MTLTLPVSHCALIVEIARRAAGLMQADVRVLVLYLTHRHAERPLDLHGLRYAPDSQLLPALGLIPTEAP